MTGPAPGAPYDTPPPDTPATLEDVRASRRWTWVALAWAVAASAIAVIALVQDNKSSSNSGTPTTTSQDVATQLAQFEKQTNDRLDAFSKRLDGTATSADLQKLDKRLTQTEKDVSKIQDSLSKQSNTLTQTQTDIKDLQQRVTNLENQQKQQSNGQTGTGTTTTP